MYNLPIFVISVQNVQKVVFNLGCAPNSGDWCSNSETVSENADPGRYHASTR